MGDVAIRAEGLGKQYRIGERQKYKALRDTLTDALYVPLRKARSLFGGSNCDRVAETTIWALKDVSFEIIQGEVVGVIGRNGAGKSTLLKILSRITEPTRGFVDVCGRVGSLLEVGTGFHPELTGRENVYLNGSIIGMRKGEIDRKFDEIVAFAEIEQFLDTPIKFYSSGMYMRLAFSVAAHLEPEILLVDEVLAVGDAVFQKKCLGKIGDVAKSGRTVVFVSHNLAAIRSICQKCIVLEKGQLALSGNANHCVDYHLSGTFKSTNGSSVVFSNPSKQRLRMRAAAIICNESPSTRALMGDTMAISVKFASDMPIRRPQLGFTVSNQEGISILHGSNRYQPSPEFDTPVTEGEIRCDLGMVPLSAGQYSITLYFGDQGEDTHVVKDALYFEVLEKDVWGCGKIHPSNVSSLWWPTNFRFYASNPPQNG